MLALLGGDEWTKPCEAFDRQLLEHAGTSEVLVLPAAAAFENPEDAVARASTYFAGLGAKVTNMNVLTRRDADAQANVAAARTAKFVYIADGSPLHLRSVLKGSEFYDALVYAYRERGAVIAASGAGATVLCDPMVDPRGGAYTVGLGIVSGLAIFPYHGTTADHLRERSIDLLSDNASLVGVDEATALIRQPDGGFSVAGAGRITVYRKGVKPKTVKSGGTLEFAPTP
ncbi:MAG TPA: Type 1 glutamine amidotransferase-like domain-containing protein [Acidimicrobiia bacterium]|nr:Type 1 glutamine amidotransferase-like domain-containing protein [Acidimicrobiia bacterium]